MDISNSLREKYSKVQEFLKGLESWKECTLPAVIVLYKKTLSDAKTIKKNVVNIDKLVQLNKKNDYMFVDVDMENEMHWIFNDIYDVIHNKLRPIQIQMLTTTKWYKNPTGSNPHGVKSDMMKGGIAGENKGNQQMSRDDKIKYERKMKETIATERSLYEQEVVNGTNIPFYETNEAYNKKKQRNGYWLKWINRQNKKEACQLMYKDALYSIPVHDASVINVYKNHDWNTTKIQIRLCTSEFETFKNIMEKASRAFVCSLDKLDDSALYGVIMCFREKCLKKSAVQEGLVHLNYGWKDQANGIMLSSMSEGFDRKLGAYMRSSAKKMTDIAYPNVLFDINLLIRFKVVDMLVAVRGVCVIDTTLCERIDNSSGDVRTCCICMDHDVDVSIVGCNHRFCLECMTNAFHKNTLCPLCRGSMAQYVKLKRHVLYGKLPSNTRKIGVGNNTRKGRRKTIKF